MTTTASARLTRYKHRGETSPNAQLTDALVVEARRRYRDGERSADIAADFGVKPSMLRHAITGKSWAHVPGAVDPGAHDHTYGSGLRGAAGRSKLDRDPLTPEQGRAVRDWARAAGCRVPARGRLPTAVVNAYALDDVEFVRSHYPPETHPIEAP